MITRWWIFKVGVGLWLLADAMVCGLGYRMAVLPLATPLWVGQCLAVLGALVHLWHYGILKRATRNLARPACLVRTGGLFGAIRHPMYFGDLLLYLGLALMTGDGLSFVVYGLGSAAILGQCQVEDRQLAGLFGEEFARWRERTRLVFPIPRSHLRD